MKTRDYRATCGVEFASSTSLILVVKTKAQSIDQRASAYLTRTI